MDVGEVAQTQHGQRLLPDRFAGDVPVLERRDVHRVNVPRWPVDVGVDNVVTLARQLLCLLGETPHPVPAWPHIALVDADLTNGKIVLKLVGDDRDLMVHGHGRHDVDAIAFGSAKTLPEAVHEHSDAQPRARRARERFG